MVSLIYHKKLNDEWKQVRGGSWVDRLLVWQPGACSTGMHAASCLTSALPDIGIHAHPHAMHGRLQAAEQLREVLATAPSSKTKPQVIGRSRCGPL